MSRDDDDLRFGDVGGNNSSGGGEDIDLPEPIESAIQTVFGLIILVIMLYALFKILETMITLPF